MKRTRKNTQDSVFFSSKIPVKCSLGEAGKSFESETDHDEEYNANSFHPPDDEQSEQAGVRKEYHTSPTDQDVEEDWMMATSSGYEYDFFFENMTNTQLANPIGQQGKNAAHDTKTARTLVDFKEDKTGNTVGEVRSKKTLREKKIKCLKTLLRKQEKAIIQLKSKYNHSGQGAGTLDVNYFSETKTERGRVVSPVKRRGTRTKIKPCPADNQAENIRVVDILMSKEDQMTKDEFLAVLGLARIAKFH